jgi:predicted permease
MHSFQQNLRFALRQLRKTPGVAIVCVLTLALGIGANTAVFSVMNAVLLRSLPVADPSRVFYVYTTSQPQNASNTGNSDSSFSYPVYQALRRQTEVFAEAIAYVPLSIDKIAVRIGSSPEEAEADMVSGNFFSGLGVRIERGRGFTAQDEAGHTPTAVISYGYWTRRFSRNPDALGQTMVVKGVPITIVGIAAQGFEGVEAGNSTDFWIPLQNRAELNAWGMEAADGKLYLAQPTWWCLRMLARLAPGVSREQAVARVQGVFQAAAYEGLGKPRAGEKPPVFSLHEAKNFPGYDEYYGQPIKVLMSMVGLVLLIALSNVAMLLVARNTIRQREFSLRLALGAGRGQLFRQLLTESLLLVAAGGLMAWLFAALATRVLADWSGIESSLAPDRTVLLFTLGVLMLAALVFGLAPLRTALSSGPALVLKTSAATANLNRSKARSGRIVVAVQMALCLTLLAGAGLLLRTLHNLETLPLGMRTEGLVVFSLNPQTTHTNAEAIAFYDQLTARLRTLPGIRGVTAMENRLGSGWSNNNGVPPIDGAEPAKGGLVRNNVVGADFFHTLGVPILAGRDFTDADNATAPPAAIINETFAKTYLPNRSPVGHHIGLGGADKTKMAAIVGVVKDNKYTSITEKPIPMIWFPYMQSLGGVGEMHLELRVATGPGGDPMTILPAVRHAVAEMDSNLPLQQPMTQRAQFEESISQQQLFARLAGFFGLIAVLLVATGLYGTMAYRVSNRTMEIGVRMALGAKRGHVVWMIVRESLVLAATGVALGVPLVLLMSHLLSSQLFGVQAYDATSYMLAVAGVALVAMIATLVPAQRAASVDPVRALRSE